MKHSKVLALVLVLVMLLSTAAFAEGLPTPSNYGTVTDKNPVVETKFGPVKGKSENGVAMFRGIPYGGDVDGANRFLPASDPEPWTETMDCTYLKARAIQSVGKNGDGNLFQEYVGDYFAGGRIGELTLNDQYQDENCLLVNVVTPGLDDAKRPVIVYVHGGGYREGSNAITAGAYGLSREEDVVIVGVNHRLNVFGYLYLGEFDDKYAESANISMLDVVKALEWVRDNIESFGGDPNNVMIMGESGGGGKMTALLLMEKAQGLYNTIVCQSGSTSSGWMAKETAVESAKKVLDVLGIGTDELDKLADVPTMELYNAMKSANVSFTPVVDGINLTCNMYSPVEEIESALANNKDVSIILTNAEFEQKWLGGNGNRALFDITEETLAENVAALSEGLASKTDAFIAAYKAEYPDYTAADIYFRIWSDMRFGNNADHMADILSGILDGGVYRYVYYHDCPIEGGMFGAYHTADLPLIFRMVMYEQDELMSRELAAFHAAFARTGNPDTDYFDWKEYTVEEQNIAYVDDEITNHTNPYPEIRELWASIA